MKDLLKQAFQAGRDFGHAMGTGRPTYGLTFDEWYSENENQALSIANVVGRSEQLKAFVTEVSKGFDDSHKHKIVKKANDILKSL